MRLCTTEPHWPEHARQERTRLRGCLGTVVEGGVIEASEHIGATSVPGVPARPVIDIGLAVWPFPLQPGAQAALESLGYSVVPGSEGAPEQRFGHSTGAFQLLLVEPGSQRWTDYLLLRDFLCTDEPERRAYTQQKHLLGASLPDPAAYEHAKAALLQQTQDAARRWWVSHHGFAPLHAVVHELRTFSRPWYIASGWALDLFLGRVTRVHHDVDVGIARTDQRGLYEYMTQRGWKFVTPVAGLLKPWPPDTPLEPAVHQAHAHRAGAFIDFLWSDIEGGSWHYRRDPAITRALQHMSLLTPDDIPFLAPELVLLFKSKNTSGRERSKDHTDFERVHGSLGAEQRAWLRSALLLIDPTHPWIAVL